MPHSCFGALSYQYDGFLQFLTSEEAFKVVEATAASGTVYQIIAKTPLKKLTLPVTLILMASIMIKGLQTNEAAIFAERMKRCLPAVHYLQSPEPVKNSPYREASHYREPWPLH